MLLDSTASQETPLPSGVKGTAAQATRVGKSQGVAARLRPA